MCTFVTPSSCNYLNDLTEIWNADRLIQVRVNTFFIPKSVWLLQDQWKPEIKAAAAAGNSQLINNKWDDITDLRFIYRILSLNCDDIMVGFQEKCGAIWLCKI